jgi:hypothetical protein
MIATVFMFLGRQGSLIVKIFCGSLPRDVTTRKKVQLCQWWADSAPPGWNKVKVSENVGATPVALVAPVDTSLLPIPKNKYFQHSEVNSSQFSESSEIYYKNLKGNNQSYVKLRYFERDTTSPALWPSHNILTLHGYSYKL